MKRLVALLPLACLGASLPAEPPSLRLPLACTLGQGCAIQSYVDDDPGPAVRDHQCQGRTYQAHNGTDFRIASMARQRAGVAVLAATAGTVLRARDGVADVSVRAVEAAKVPGQECGNGLVIDHGGDWETQYCHLARGSIAVRPGDKVVAGAMLGRVGLSGNTEFPHVHLTVRQDGQVVDPFAWGRPAGSCRGGRSLWAATPAYRQGEVLVTGFAAGPLTMAEVQERGAEQEPRPDRNGPALVAFAQAIGLMAGDVQRIVLRGPGGVVIAENRAPPLERDKAQLLLFAGKKTPAGGWPAGSYVAEYSVERGGARVIEQRWITTL